MPPDKMIYSPYQRHGEYKNGAVQELQIFLNLLSFQDAHRPDTTQLDQGTNDRSYLMNSFTLSMKERERGFMSWPDTSANCINKSLALLLK